MVPSFSVIFLAESIAAVGGLWHRVSDIVYRGQSFCSHILFTHPSRDTSIAW